MSISVVIPVFNRGHSVAIALRSLEQQPHRPIEIIVVDDGSTDDTIDAIYEQARHIGASEGVSVKIISQRNQGATAARNAGLSECSYPFVAFLDSDDFVEDDILGALVRALVTTSADLGFGPWVYLDKATGRRGKIRQPDYGSPYELFYRWLGRSDFVPPCSVVWRSEFIRQLGGWKAGLRRNQDGELVARALLGGAKFCLSEEGCGVYVIDKAGKSISRNSATLSANFDIARALLLLSRRQFSELEVRRVVSRYYYTLAIRCFAERRPRLGRVALRRSRMLGFHGHQGPIYRITLATIFGVSTTERILQTIKVLMGR